MNKISKSFPPCARLRKRVEFLRLQKKSSRINTKHLTVTITPNQHKTARLGIIATRKIGNAVKRNRGKRLVREAFRRHQYLFPLVDIVVILRRNTHEANQLEIDQEMLLTLKKDRK